MVQDDEKSIGELKFTTSINAFLLILGVFKSTVESLNIIFETFCRVALSAVRGFKYVTMAST